MAPADGEESFRVTDRRRRTEVEESPPLRAETPSPSPSGAVAESGRSLVDLFMMLGSSALMALGEAADPSTGRREHDLPGAADLIDLLVLLREKTEGHRSPEETQVLDELIYDLQLRYVSATKSSG
jgi:hypothetical protein